MKRIKHFFALVLIVALAVQIASCANTNESAKGSNSSSTSEQSVTAEMRHRKGRPNDEIVVSMGAYIPHEFDPKSRYGMYNEAHITHSTLLRRTADLEIVGNLAKGYHVSDDAMTWSFDLHDDFKFSNGELVTDEDVKFSFEMLIEDGRHWSLDFVDRIEIPAPNRIVFTLKTSRSTFLQSQLVEVPIVPQAHYNENYKFNPTS